jgi:WD40 repeat protein
VAWPVSQDYNEAVQAPATCFSDPDLRAGEAAANALGIPQPCSGNFADVYELRCRSGKWAVKCFTRQVAGLEQRYAAVSAHLQQARLPFGVEFHYLPQGIRIRGTWYPVLKMRWVEGLTLNAFVRDSLDKPVLLDALGQIWLRMARRLHEADVAHGDLQHGNVLLVPGRTPQALAVKLIDYDGMWVPALASSPSGEVGHPNYQHPQRLRASAYGPEVDRFPLLVVATALRCIRFGGRSLWERHDNGDNLLFKEADLASPRTSPLFAELLSLRDPVAVKLVRALMASAAAPLEASPLLENLLTDRSTQPASRPKAPAEAAPGFDFDSDEDEGRARRRRRRRQRKPALPLVLGGVGAAVLLIGGLVGWSLLPSTPETTSGPAGTHVAINQGTRSTPPHGTPPSGGKAAPPTTAAGGPGQQDLQVKPVGGIALLSAGPCGEVRRIDTNLGPIWGVAVSPDGKYLLSAGDRGLILWDASTGEPVHRLDGHKGRVWGVAYSSDGRRILSGGADHTVRLWDARSGEQLQLFTGHGGQVDRVAFGPDPNRVFSTARDGTSRIWNVGDGTEVALLGERNQSGYALAVAPDGQRALFAVGDDTLRLWDIKGQKAVRRLKGHTAHVYSIAFSPTGQRAASGGGEGIIHIWDLEKGEEVGHSRQLAKPIQGLVFLKDGRLVSCCDDGAVQLWDTATLEELCRFEGHTGAVRGVAVTAGGRYAVSGATDGTLRLWRLPAAEVVHTHPETPGSAVYTFSKHTGEVRRVAISIDGRQALTAGLDGSLRLWDLTRGEQVKELRGPVANEGQYMVAFLPGGRALGGGQDKSLHLWDLGKGKQIAAWPGHTGAIYHLACSPDGRWAVSCGPEKTVFLWDVLDGTVAHRLDAGDSGATNVAISADGQRAAAVCIDGFVRVWDVVKGSEVSRLDKGPHQGEGVAISPDHHLVAAAWQKAVGVWETETGKPLLKLEGHTSDAWAVSFTLDGRRLVSAGTDGTVRVWDLSTAKEIARYTDHTAWVSDVACTPDGRYALSSSRDGTARLWRLPAGPLVFGAPLKIQPNASLAAGKPPPDREKPKRLAPPDREAVKVAEGQLREAYAADYEKRKPEDRLALANKLLQAGKAKEEQPSVRFAALREASDLAADLHQVAVSLEAIDALGQAFEVDVAALDLEALTRARKVTRSPAQFRALADAALQAADKAAAADQYSGAIQLLTIANEVAFRTVNIPLQTTVRLRKERFDHLAKEYPEVEQAAGKLLKDPDAADANLLVGRFRCLEKEEWERGLPFLAKGSDVGLAEAAKKDLAVPTDPQQQLEAANLWWALAEKDTAKAALQRRARLWYWHAWPGLAGLDKTRVARRLEITIGTRQLLPGLVTELHNDEALTSKVKTRIDYQINANWGFGAPDEVIPVDHFSVRWRGWLVPPRRGTYLLYVHADDGARVFLNKKVVLDNWDRGGRTETTITLDEPAYELMVDFHEGIGTAMMIFGWRPEGAAEAEPIPMEAFYHDLAQEKVLGK